MTPRPQIARFFAQQQQSSGSGLCHICGDWSYDPNMGGPIGRHHPRCPEVDTVAVEVLPLVPFVLKALRCRECGSNPEPIQIAIFDTALEAMKACDRLVARLIECNYWEFTAALVEGPPVVNGKPTVIWRREVVGACPHERETTPSWWRRLVLWWRGK